MYNLIDMFLTTLEIRVWHPSKRLSKSRDYPLEAGWSRPLDATSIETWEQNSYKNVLLGFADLLNRNATAVKFQRLAVPVLQSRALDESYEVFDHQNVHLCLQQFTLGDKRCYKIRTYPRIRRK